MLEKFYVSRDILNSIIDYSERNDKEICGIITGKKIGNDMFAKNINKIKNLSKYDTEVDYVMNPSEVYNTLRNTTFFGDKDKDDFVATFHSHPNNMGIPSKIDIARAEYNVVYLIYGKIDGVLRSWKLAKDKKKMEIMEMIIV